MWLRKELTLHTATGRRSIYGCQDLKPYFKRSQALHATLYHLASYDNTVVQVVILYVDVWMFSRL